MKLTAEEENEVTSKWKQLSKRIATMGNQDAIDLVKWALDKFSKLPENTTQWIHCSDRLPERYDANSKGEVWALAVTTPSYHACSISFHALSSHDDIWWATPIKQFKKPSPPDPFEEWCKNIQELNEQIRDLLKDAYELGRKNPKAKGEENID